MCLAVPAHVVAVDEDGAMAVVDLAGIQKEVSTLLVDDVQAGDYLLIHVGFALHKLSEEEAQATLDLFAEFDAMSIADGKVEG
ncbi:MAG: HypC/HybG/HupF family hydrogenase formation chaperone [Mariprofundales bacterium]|nr:HypC/HybG/HupF family hydrogenase formation chaperone [Mariprofundales bacterium]